MMMGRKEASSLMTVIGADSSLKGELVSKGTVRIDGAFDGNMQADSVIIGESGLIKGDIVSRNATIGGKLEGSVTCTEAVSITPKGHVLGDISTPKLSLPEGGIFEGRAHMLDTPSSTVVPFTGIEK
jgi:cytoskeletal protein CcmA (bactofilin family)